MKQIKQNLSKSLLATIGQNKVCDSLAGINKAFDILLKAQKESLINEAVKQIKEIKEAVSKRHGTHKYDGCYEDSILTLLILKK